MKNALLILCLTLLSTGFLKAQIVNIPDANFKAYLVNNPEINTNGDDEIQLSEAEAFTDTLNCSSLSIEDLTGIEAFVNLKYLDCSRNKFTNLNVSQNIMLEYLDCSSDLTHYLTRLDLSKNVALKYLDCSMQRITTLDLSQNVVLEYLDCSDNEIKAYEAKAFDLRKNVGLKKLFCSWNILFVLDISENILLEELDCTFNVLPKLDVSKNVALEKLNCSRNVLYTLELGENISLKELNCSISSLTSLDLSQNIGLKKLDCSYTSLSTLAVSHNVALEGLLCNNSRLKRLNLKNRNNINLIQMNAGGNPDLSCIEVDDVDLANSQGLWRKDFFSEYSTDCQYISTSEFSLKETHFYPNPVEDMLYFEKPMSAIRLVDYSGRVIQEYKYTIDRINLASLTDGVYFIVGRTAGGEYVGGKVVKTGK